MDWTGFSLTEGATWTVVTNNGLTVKVTFTNVTTPNSFKPSPMNLWAGALLSSLYGFSNTNVRPALYDGSNGLVAGSYHYDMTITATRGGNPVKFTLVTADAEGSSLSERTYLNTNGSPWTTLEFIRTSGQTDDPLLGCNTQAATILDTHEDASNAALIGQLPVIATSSPGATALTLNITLDHGTTLGGMGLAFGIFIPVDRGDLLPSYGTVQHELSQFDPGESVTTVVPANATSATLTWTGLPTWLPTGAAIGYGFRFRLSSDEQATQSPQDTPRTER
jgi:hypothetical protein